MSFRNAVLALAGTFLTGFAAFGQMTTSTTFTSTSNLPPVGLAASPAETAVVTLINNAKLPAATPSNFTAPSCAGAVSFYNSSGVLIGSATSFKLTSGEITSVSLPYASTGASTTRALVQVVVSLMTTFPNSTPCALSYSLSITDATSGVTHAIVTDGGMTQVTPILGRF